MSIQKMCLQCSFHSLYLGINLNFECSPPLNSFGPPKKWPAGGGEKVLGGAKNPKIFRASREIKIAPPPKFWQEYIKKAVILEKSNRIWPENVPFFGPI